MLEERIKAVRLKMCIRDRRLASYIQEVDSVYDIEWAPGVKYGEIFLQPEYEHSKYSFEVSDQDMSVSYTHLV